MESAYISLNTNISSSQNNNSIQQREQQQRVPSSLHTSSRFELSSHHEESPSSYTDAQCRNMISNGTVLLCLYYMYNLILVPVCLALCGWATSFSIVGSEGTQCFVGHFFFIHLFILIIGLIYAILVFFWIIFILCRRISPPSSYHYSATLSSCEGQYRRDNRVYAIGNAWMLSPLTLIGVTVALPYLLCCKSRENGTRN